jgi:3',5'-cyclic AMP phosphodiesterase CpdA
VVTCTRASEKRFTPTIAGRPRESRPATATVAHISDLHFGREIPEIVSGLLADLAATDPDLIIVSGDLTERALHSQFRAARDFLDRLPAPYLVCPGNHDIPLYRLDERFLRPTARFRRHISADLGPVHHGRGFTALGLNSAHGRTWKSGRVEAGPLARLCAAVEAAPAGNLRIVAAHHPFLPPPDAPQSRLVDDAESILTALAACGADLILGGHIHRAFAGDARRTFPHLPAQLLVAQAPTATSVHLRDRPNGYNLIHFGEAFVEIAVRYWTAGTRGFETESSQRFSRTRRDTKPADGATARMEAFA